MPQTDSRVISAPPTGRISRKWYVEGFQDAMHQLTEILDRDGVDAMLEYLRNNTVRRSGS
jgi:hypothetical protein